MNLRRFSILPLLAAIALLYFVVAKLSLRLAFVNASASSIWPATGIALAALLLLGYRIWPAIFAGAFLVNILTTGNFVTSLCLATGNILEAVCAAWLITRLAGGVRAFDRAQDVFKFALSAVFSSLISPTIGVTCLTMAGLADWANYQAIFLTWWMADAIGALVVTPLIVLWNQERRWTFDPKRDVEVALLLLCLIFIAQIVFGGWFPIRAANYPISFLCGPVVIWAAFRLSQRETATGIFVLTAIATWGTLHGAGPFVMKTADQSLLIMNTSTAVLTVTALALAAAMSERRRAEAAIERQKAAIEVANKTKDTFLAMLSHELRTPLTPVLAALDSLDATGLNSEESKASLAMIRRNVELESQLIDDLLDLTRIAKDKLQLHFVEMDVHEAISNVAEICKTEARARNIQVHLNLRAGAHFISGDTAKFQQIIWNLLKNAIKFTNDSGEITINSTNPLPHTLTIAVGDNGIGMEREIMERIFDPFEQGEQSLQRRFGGLGLGLAISKSLAQAHGGTLVAQSEGRGYGSTFTLTLNTISPPQPRTARQATPASVSPRAFRILLVDDHQDTCSALERLLVRRGHLVAATHNVRSAMEAAGRNQFDLLISDIALPDGTGMELMACLRAISGLRGIAISGFGMNGDIEKSLRAGFSEHLVKPVKLERLEAAIDRVMSAT
jgi:signal transduction histidine kinase/CheY-like chemotaxis protein